MTEVRNKIVQEIANLETLVNTYTLEKKVKAERIKSLQTSVISLLDGATEADASKAELAFWKGKVLDASPEYSKDAEAFLSKAVKLEPSLVEAWNCLGNSFWKKGDLNEAKNCFENALKQNKNKDSLRHLSMLIKNIGDAKDRGANIALSMKYAHDAVGMDVKDGNSWYTLGNAYLAHFFSVTRDMGTMDKALKAYNAAETSTNPSASSNPDLYFNRSTVMSFAEDYQGAIQNYQQAHKLDPSLNAEEKADFLRRLVIKLSRNVTTKMALKSKKIHELIGVLPLWDEEERDKADTSLRYVGFKDLKEGPNANTLLAGVVVGTVTRETDTPVSFLLMDRNADVVVVSLYNVAGVMAEKIKVKDQLRISSPILKNIRTQIDEQVVTYPCLQLYEPTSLLLNGQPLERTVVAAPQLKTQTFA